jgi:uncharacterized protein YuzE
MNENIKYDSGSDTLYLFVQEGYEAKFIEVAPGINVELDDNGQLIGIEILNVSRLLPLIINGQPAVQTQATLLK